MSLQERAAIVRRLTDSGEQASTDQEVLAYLAQPKSALFLIICNLPNGAKYSMLHTRDELKIKKIPPGVFHRAASGLNLHVLVEECRTVEFCVKNGWL